MGVRVIEKRSLEEVREGGTGKGEERERGSLQLWLMHAHCVVSGRTLSEDDSEDVVREG